jgi:hypothetical protein
VGVGVGVGQGYNIKQSAQSINPIEYEKAGVVSI